MSSKPMSAEYAKSAKSGCKGCKKNIGKGELRFGFVGKANFGATAWYHYGCIWSDLENLKSVDGSKAAKEIIDGYSELRKEDRDKTDKDFPKACKAAADKAKEPVAAKSGPAFQMAAEYAKSAKSSCKGCLKIIDKGALRVGFQGKANFGATAWYHYDCVWKDIENLKSIDSSKTPAAIIEGYSELKQQDQANISKDLPKFLKVASSSEVIKHPMEADYAKSDKSNCKDCSKKIAKDALRVGFKGKANFGGTSWYHFDCLSSLSSDFFVGINAADSIQYIIDGFDHLKKADQTKVEKKIKDRCCGSTETAKRKHGSQDNEGKDQTSPAKKTKTK